MSLLIVSTFVLDSAISIWKNRVMKFVLTLSSILLVRNLATYAYRKKRRFPPGPLGVPLLGSLPYVAINPTQFHSYLARRYGPITYYQYGYRDRIIINDYKIAKLILNREDFTNRPHYFDFKVNTIHDDKRSLAELDGQAWKKRRRFYHLILMRMLSGKFIDETLEYSVTNFILPKMEKLKNLKQPWKMKKYLYQSVVNSIFMLLFGENIDTNDPLFDRLTTLLHEYSVKLQNYHTSALNNLLHSSPLLQNIANTLNVKLETRVEVDLKEKYQQILDLLTTYIESRSKSKRTLKKDKLRCILDHLLEISQNQGPKMTEGTIATESVMLFAESIDSLTATCEMGLLIACKYPHVQNEVYNEMKQVFTEYHNKRQQRAQRWKNINERRQKRLLNLQLHRQDSMPKHRPKASNFASADAVASKITKHTRFETTSALLTSSSPPVARESSLPPLNFNNSPNAPNSDKTDKTDKTGKAAKAGIDAKSGTGTPKGPETQPPRATEPKQSKASKASKVSKRAKKEVTPDLPPLHSIAESDSERSPSFSPLKSKVTLDMLAKDPLIVAAARKSLKQDLPDAANAPDARDDAQNVQNAQSAQETNDDDEEDSDSMPSIERQASRITLQSNYSERTDDGMDGTAGTQGARGTGGTGGGSEGMLGYAEPYALLRPHSSRAALPGLDEIDNELMTESKDIDLSALRPHRMVPPKGRNMNKIGRDVRFDEKDQETRENSSEPERDGKAFESEQNDTVTTELSLKREDSDKKIDNYDEGSGGSSVGRERKESSKRQRRAMSQIGTLSPDNLKSLQPEIRVSMFGLDSKNDAQRDIKGSSHKKMQSEFDIKRQLSAERREEESAVAGNGAETVVNVAGIASIASIGRNGVRGEGRDSLLRGKKEFAASQNEMKRDGEDEERLGKDESEGGLEFRAFLLHKLPKLRAFTHEVLRLAAPVPVTLHGKGRIVKEPLLLSVKQNSNWTDPDDGNTKHVENDYLLQPGMTVHCNFKDMHRYSEDWIRPNGVCLEHWLNENEEFVKREDFLIFSIGRRGCTGQMIVLKQLFLLFGSLLWKYKFDFPKKLQHHVSDETEKNKDMNVESDGNGSSTDGAKPKPIQIQIKDENNKNVKNEEKVKRYKQKLDKIKEVYRNEEFSLDDLRVYEKGVWQVKPDIDLVIMDRD